jgi:hypothetical protein
MNTSKRPTDTTEAWWTVLTAILKSMKNRPIAWLLGEWLSGWALFAWHAIHPASWDTVWAIVNSALARAQDGGVQPPDPQAGVTWLQEVARWGQIALFFSTGLLALYAGYALWVWWRYTNTWMPEVRVERLRGGRVRRVLEVLIPMGSKADGRAAADMYGQLRNFLTEMADGGFGARKMGAERTALSLEIWSTPATAGKVGFYVWCPAITGDQHRSNNSMEANEAGDHFIEEVRHLIKAYYPRSRVRWVDDPVRKAMTDLTRTPGTQATEGALDTTGTTGSTGTTVTSLAVTWYELGLRADSRYPIALGGSGERLLSGSRSSSGDRPGSPGAGSDLLAAMIGTLGSEKAVPVIGIQVVIVAQAENVAQTRQAANKELARLSYLEAQAGKKALGPQHEARLLALQEKADSQGFDVTVRLVAVEQVEQAGYMGGASGAAAEGRAETRLASLLRNFKQYDRSIAGVSQGFQVVGKSRVALTTARSLATRLRAASPPLLWRVGPVLGRWPREGVCLPRLLPFMKAGKACILNMAELSAIYHFPHQGLDTLANIRRASYRHIPSSTVAHITEEPRAKGQRVILGTLDDDLPPANTERAVSGGARAETHESGEEALAGMMTLERQGTNVLPPGTLGVGPYFEDLRRGTYVLGPMGSGKSVFLYNMVVQHMAAGRGIGILDGKGDSYEEVLRLVPPYLEGGVLTFDPENRSMSGGSGGTGGRSIGINPLDSRVTAQLGAEKVESMAMSLMKKMMGANWEQAVLMQRFMRDGFIAVSQVEPAPTMLNLWRWMQDDGKGGNEYREALLGRITNRLVQDFWQRQVPAMSSQQRSSMQNVLTRVDRYVKNDVRYLLLQPYSTVNFQEIMDRGTIFVGRVSPRLGEDQSFLGALVLNGFLTGAFARQNIPQERRRDYLLVVDEFQNFVDTGQADVERMLSMARGYRLGLMLAHQYTDQLPREVLNAILKNVQTWVVFALQADDARLFAKHMEGLEPQDFQNLPPYYTYQRTIVNNVPTGVYSAGPLPPPVHAANPGKRIVRNPDNERKEEIFREAMEMGREFLRTAHAPDNIMKLVFGGPEESEEARRTRILKLAREIYWPAEEGNPEAVQVLSTLSDADREVYRQARHDILDREERNQLLAHPGLIRDKVERIERLSSLRWGTPCAEVEALILATLRGTAGQSDGGASGSAREGRPPQSKPYSLTPDPDED